MRFVAEVAALRACFFGGLALLALAASDLPCVARACALAAVWSDRWTASP